MPVADPPVTNQLMSAIKRAERIFSQPLTRAALILVPEFSATVGKGRSAETAALVRLEILTRR